MKRSFDFVELVERAEKRHRYRRDALSGFRKFFVVVEGPQTGIFEAYDDFTASLSIYKQFNNCNAALAWFERALQRPSLFNPAALEIHTSGRNYDVSQDKDHYAAVAVYFGRGDARNLCLSANRDADYARVLDFMAFLKALELAPLNVPLRIITDSKRIAYGINYGLREWPKHDLNANTQPVLWERIEANLALRSEERQVVAVDFQRDKNRAFQQATDCCREQMNSGSRWMPPWVRILRTQCDAWSLCAIRMGKLPRDLRRLIARFVWRGTDRSTNQNICF